MQERRECGRWRIKQPVNITLHGEDNPCVCEVEDIGLKGAKIRAPWNLEKGDTCRLNIALDEDFSLNVDASVIWGNTQAEGKIYGVYFIKIQDEDKGNIYKHVCANYPQAVRNNIWDGIV